MGRAEQLQLCEPHGGKGERDLGWGVLWARGERAGASGARVMGWWVVEWAGGTGWASTLLAARWEVVRGGLGPFRGEEGWSQLGGGVGSWVGWAT